MTKETRFPVEAALPPLKEALRSGPNAVLVAPPGAGKTTVAPLALLEEPWARDGRLVLLAPRRIAARAAASRMAGQRGETVGETVGFRVRLESRVSSRTRIEVVTEGVFTRMLQEDPTLDGVSGVLFDEYHERSLEGDLGLALALETQDALRPDLRLVVMSATIDGARAARLLGGAPVIESAGRMHPVELRYLGRDPREPVERAMAAAVRRALAEEEGSVLAFLPGVAEIERTCRLLGEADLPGVSLHPLHGGLDPAAQDRAIEPAGAGRRKVVLATAIAETSLTIEGVRVVVDCGLSRRPAFEPGAAVTRLETGRVSRASAEQRRGRAGRTGPGVCYRLWEEAETASLTAFDPPEILNADLCGFALELAAWGVADPAALRLPDAPPAAAWSDAVATLRRLGALCEAGRLTDHGRAMAQLGLAPRHAHLMLKSCAAGFGALACEAVILLGERGLGGRSADLAERLRGWRADRGERARAARGVARRLAERIGARWAEQSVDRLGAVLALGFPERVGRARSGQPGVFQLANGRSAALPPEEPLAGARFLVAADVTGRAAQARVLSAAAIEEADVEALFAEQIVEQVAVTFDGARGAMQARRRRALDRLTLSEAPLARPSGAALRAAWIEALRTHGPGLIPWEGRARQLRARVAFLNALGLSAWPDWSDEALLEAHADAIANRLESFSELRSIPEGFWFEVLSESLPWPDRRRLDTWAPERFESPAGRQHPIDYEDAAGPSVSLRLQEMFGTARHPTLAEGRVAIVLHLLSPAGRPVQSTSDIAAFWAGSYQSVRADLRGRYPKHPWPDAPLLAAPTDRAKPRGG